jgi:hypothetical protein
MQTAVTLRERVRAVLMAIQGIESAAVSQDSEKMNAYLQLLNEVATGATQEADVIAQRQEQLMAGLLSDAQVIAKNARRAHSRSSLFAVSALGALAAGVVLTVRHSRHQLSGCVEDSSSDLREEPVFLWAEQSPLSLP